MKLILEVTSEERHLLGDNAKKCFQAVGGVIGRNPQCDWVIPDQKRHMSGQHAVISCEEGAFHITDVSTNGVFINGAAQPLGREATVTLNDEDRISMGNIDFIVRLQLSAEEHPFKSQTGAFASNLSDRSPDNPVARSKPLDPIALFKANNGFDAAKASVTSSPVTPRPGGALKPGAAEVSRFSRSEQIVSAPDHLPGVSNAFKPPKMLPEDWLDESSGGLGRADPIDVGAVSSSSGQNSAEVSQETRAVPAPLSTKAPHKVPASTAVQNDLIKRFFKGLGVSEKILNKLFSLS